MSNGLIMMSNMKGREYDSFDLATKQLIWTILGKAPQGTDSHIIYLGKNLRRSDMVIEVADKLTKNEPLVIQWEHWLDLVVLECLKPFHEESFYHLLRVRRLVRALKQMLAEHTPSDIPDYGFSDFHDIQEQMQLSQFTELDWLILEYAAQYHDICKLGYDPEYWTTPGKFTADQRKQLEAHARLFFNLGEFFNVFRWVVSLSVLHHYPNLKYPTNGYVARVADLLADKKFTLMLKILINLDVYEGITGMRAYQRTEFSHQQAIKKMPGELGAIGTGFIPFLHALKDVSGEAVLCPN
ncbi:hypothetical protein ACFL2U_03325 [Patescibacteria group bacterium]